ncbi:hypothetical protein PanWU01x14_196210, partial [Parasponia andersonii]
MGTAFLTFLVFVTRLGFPTLGSGGAMAFDKFLSSPNATRFLLGNWSSAMAAATATSAADLFLANRVMRTHLPCSAMDTVALNGQLSLSVAFRTKERERERE